MQQNDLITHMLSASVLGLVISLSSPGFSKDILPLKRGYYVQTDTECEDASNASLNLFLGTAFGFNCSVKNMRSIGNNKYKITQTCLQRGERFTDTIIYEIMNNTEFIEHYAHGGGPRHFRYCPQSSLPEPWRSNKIVR